MALTLFHVSDVHFGAEDSAALAAFAARVAQERPDAVICTGDITMRGTTREFAAASRWFDALAAPVAIVPGNHDVPYYWELPLRFVRPLARYDAFHVKTARPPAIPGLTLLPLLTVAGAQWRLNWSKGHVAPRAMAAVRAAARAAPAGLKLALCHHPLVDAHPRQHGGGSTRNGRAALAMLAAAGVDAVLSGHVHDAFDRTVEVGGRTIRMIGAGTICARLRSTPAGFNRLVWSAAAGLSVAVVDV